MKFTESQEDIAFDADLLQRLRREELHRHPEISGEENDTARRITDFLGAYAPPDKLIQGLGGTGLAAVYGHDEQGPTILIRCELDGLPIPEEANHDYPSRNPGISHVCGHDGHMAIVSGLATLLHEHRTPRGRVVLLYQPAEENGMGAVAILKDPAFEAIRPDYVFALHNLPGYPLHALVTHEGRFTASVTSMILTFKGKTAHAGEPENGINPAFAIAHAVQAASAHHRNIPESDDFTVVTPVYMTLGEKAYGVAAGYGELHLTIRCWTMDKLKGLCSVMEEEMRKIAEAENLELEISYTQEFQANVNDDTALNYVLKAARRLDLDIIERETPFKWGEDFGQFTQVFPGAMFGLGAGTDTSSLHNPDYDFPDALTETGAFLFFQIIQEILDGA